MQAGAGEEPLRPAIVLSCTIKSPFLSHPELQNCCFFPTQFAGGAAGAREEPLRVAEPQQRPAPLPAPCGAAPQHQALVRSMLWRGVHVLQALHACTSSIHRVPQTRPAPGAAAILRSHPATHSNPFSLTHTGSPTTPTCRSTLLDNSINEHILAPPPLPPGSPATSTCRTTTPTA